MTETINFVEGTCATTAINRASISPLHLQLKDILTELAMSPCYRDGMPFLSEHKIADTYKVSRPTVRDALKELIHDKIMIKVPGKGYYISKTYTQGNSPRKHHLGIVVNSHEFLQDYYHGEIIRGISEVIKCLGYDLLISCINPDFIRDDQRKRNLSYYQKIASQGLVDGFIIIDRSMTSDDFEWICQQGVSVVSIDNPQCHESKNIACMNIDHENSIYMCCSHLISKGHTSIAISLGSDNPNDPNYDYNRQMLSGYKKALQDADIPFDMSLCSFNVNQPSSIGLAVDSFLSLENKPSAFIHANFGIYSLLKCIRERGLRIPGDISVMGYCVPPKPEPDALNITALQISLPELGKQASALLNDLIDHKEGMTRRVNVDGNIQEGNSIKTIT
jgi:GntR family transcriptional regulator of arabinose operon